MKEEKKNTSNQNYNDFINFKNRYNDLLYCVKQLNESEELNRIYSVIISHQKFQCIKEFIDAVKNYLLEIIQKINKLGDERSYLSNLDLIDKSSLISKDYK